MRISDWSSDVCSSDLRHDPAGAVDILHMDVALRRRDLRQARHAARQPVDIGHRKIDPRLERRGEQVEHRVRRSAHRYVEAHRIFERLESRDIERSEEHTSELQSLMRISYAVFCLKTKKYK